MGGAAGAALPGLAIFGAALVAVLGLRWLRPRARKWGQRRGDRGYPQTTQTIMPPLPEEVVALLHSTTLCHLSTQNAESAPHLSLMRFTYVQGEEKILMSTRRDTKKFSYLKENPSVAVLVHDFPQQGDGRGSEAAGRTYSITLNGRAQTEGPEDCERYRQLHLAANPGYGQFIVGDDIAIISVLVETARICNIDDKVTVWSVYDQDGSASREST